jgi:2'-5' RNA ligase
MEKIRAFIAVELPLEIKTVLANLQAALGAGKDDSVKWVNPDSIHLTLKFLGNIDAAAISQITEAIISSVKHIHSFKLEIAEIGAFPNARSPRVVWIGLTGDVRALAMIHKSLEDTLASLGFTPEKRSFSPHLTLGRVRDRAKKDQRLALAQQLSTVKLENRPGFSVKQINLMRSELTQKGAIYTELATVML